MSTLAHSSAVELVKLYLEEITRSSKTPFILYFDSQLKDLRPLQWYVRVPFSVEEWQQINTANRPLSEKGERLMPDQLVKHRKTHSFRGPSCLCVLLDNVEYVEASIVVDPELGSMFVCAKNRCGYRGSFHFIWVFLHIFTYEFLEIVVIEEVSKAPGLLTKRYPLRCMSLWRFEEYIS
jgi:hypothetical protein